MPYRYGYARYGQGSGGGKGGYPPGSGAVAPPLFDAFDMTHVGIWDLRLRRSDYAGAAVRIERASDNAQTDIGFNSDGTFDMAAYEAYGTGSEKVVKVYDQSGNGFDFEQATLSLAPIIRTSSYNNEPCIFFAISGGVKRMRVTDFTDWNGLADAQFIMAMRQPTLSTGYPFIGGSGGRIVNWVGGGANNIYWGESGSNRSQYTKNINTGTLMRFVFDGGAATNALKARVFCNQIELTAGVVGNHATTMPAETHLDWNGTPLNGGQATDGEYFGFYYIGQDFAAQDVATVETQLIADFFTFTDANLTFEGDSLTKGYPLTGAPDNADTYPNQLATALESSTGITWNATNVAEVAEQTSTMLSQQADQVLQIRDEWRAHDIFVLWAGTNNIAADATGGTAITSTLSDITDMCQNAFDAGFVTYVLNMIPREDNDNVNPQFETDRASFNSGLAAAVSGLATVVDVAAATELSDPTNTTYFQSDKVHLKAAGNAIVAAAVQAAIEADL